MKIIKINIIKFIASVIIAIAIMQIISCSKDNTSDNPAPATPKEISFTQREIALPSQTRSLTDFFWVTKEKNKDVFYIHNNGLEPSTSNRGLYRYTATSNTFSDLTWSNNVNSSGYVSALVSDGNYLYYCANDFVRYTIGSNVWEDYNAHYPTTAKANNGEPGVTVLGSNIYFVGGRSTASQRVKYFNTMSKTWTNSADYPVNASNGPAITSDGTRYIYARSDVPNDFYRLDTQNVVWTKMADCPANIRKSSNLNIMGQLNSNTIVLLGDDKKIYVYNITDNTWKATNTTVPIADTATAHLEIATNKNKFFIFYKKTSNQIGLLEYTIN
jgi:N-acetylneuraminic acid mutarotase